MQAPDQQFLEEIKATAMKLMGPGAYGLRVYNINGDVKVLKNIAKKYGMRASHWKRRIACGSRAKNATFDK